MKTLSLLLVLPALIYAKIDIEIIASGNKAERQVMTSGNNVDIISDQEIETFQITDHNLKSAVNKHFGSMPDDVYLKSPTPWGDLYLTNDWKQVTRTLKPVNATILSVTSHPTSVLTQSFNNTSTKPAVFKAKMWQNVENTIASFWERSGKLSVQKSIDYNVDIKAMAVSGKATFSYVSKWGENVVNSQTVTVGSVVGMDIPLQPGQSVLAELIATRRSMKVKIDYNATLTGIVAVNYANLYKKHHFWSIEINKVLEAGRLKKSVSSSEVIDIGFYSDAEVVIRDYDTLDVVDPLLLIKVI